MPFTSLINPVRRLFNSRSINQNSSNPPPSYLDATTLPSYTDFTKNHTLRQQPAIFNQQYRTCEQLVYNFINKGKCSECIRLGVPATSIKNRTCWHITNSVCYIATIATLKTFCRKSSIYYENINHHMPFDKADDIPLSHKFELIRQLPELQSYQKCFYNPKQNRWVVHLK